MRGGGADSRNVRGFVKPRPACQAPTSHPGLATRSSSSHRGITASRNKNSTGKSNRRKDGSTDLRQESKKSLAEPSVSLLPSVSRDSTASITQKRCNRRIMHIFCVSCFSCMFAAAVLRAVVKRRHRVLLETIEKPRAAFRIQTAWRFYQLRRRVRCGAAARVLIPFLRRKISRILVAKEKSALLLQRVFRSQRDRHVVHWLYKTMKYNQAIHVLRQYLKRQVARRTVAFLALQRDEKMVCEERCFLAARRIIREERVELLRILDSMSHVGSATLTPLVTKTMLEEECIRRTSLGHFTFLSLGADAVNGTNILKGIRATNTAGACVLDKSLSEYGSTKKISSRMRCSSSGCASSPTPITQGNVFAHTVVKQIGQISSPCASTDTDGQSVYSVLQGTSSLENTQVVNLLGTPVVGISYSVMEKYSSFTEPPEQEPFSNLPDGPLNQLRNSFLELIMRTESIERKALELDLQNRQNELLHQINWLYIAAQAISTAPPLHAPLLLSMKEKWALSRAVQLFSEEHEGRLRIVEEYEAIPLRFLDRPILNIVAEKRRRELKERLRRSMDEGDDVLRTSVPANSATGVVGVLDGDPAGNKTPSLYSGTFSVQRKDRSFNSGVMHSQSQYHPSGAPTPVPFRKVNERPKLSWGIFPQSDRRVQTQRGSQKMPSNVPASFQAPEIGFSEAMTLDLTMHHGAVNTATCTLSPFTGMKGFSSRDGTVAREVPSDLNKSSEHLTLPSLFMPKNCIPTNNLLDAGPPPSLGCNDRDSGSSHGQLMPLSRNSMLPERLISPSPIRVEYSKEDIRVFPREEGYDYVRSSRFRRHPRLAMGGNTTEIPVLDSNVKSMPSVLLPISSTDEIISFRSRNGFRSNSRRTLARETRALTFS